MAKDEIYCSNDAMEHFGIFHGFYEDPSSSKEDMAAIKDEATKIYNEARKKFYKFVDKRGYESFGNGLVAKGIITHPKK
jgi:hypothetical protein